MPVEDDRGQPRSEDSRTDGSQVVELGPEDVLEDSRVDAVALDLGPDDVLEAVPGATLESDKDYMRLASLVGETVAELPPLPAGVTLVPASALRPATGASATPRPAKRPRSGRAVPLRDLAPAGQSGLLPAHALREAEPRSSGMLGIGLVGILVIAGSIAVAVHDRGARVNGGAIASTPPAVDPSLDATDPAAAEAVGPAIEERAEPAIEPVAAPPTIDPPTEIAPPTPQVAPPVPAEPDDEPVVIVETPTHKKPKPTPVAPPTEEEEEVSAPSDVAQSQECKDRRRAASLAREAGDWKAMSVALERGECWPAKEVLAELRKKAKAELARAGK